MDAFLGKESFPGPWIGIAAGGGSYAGQARFTGCIAFCNWRREDVRALLPEELDLAMNTSSTPEVHPIAFMFGEQAEGATIFGGITFPMRVSYRELALAIPFVKHRRGTNLHVFVPRMYSSFFPATWAGNAHYGLAKQMASMEWRGTQFEVATPDGARLLRAAAEPDGDWTPAPHGTLPSFAAMRDVFALPILGRRADGSYVTSYFGWDFGEAHVRPARAELSIDVALAEGLTPRSCTALPSGTFEVRRMIWRLSWPLPCRF